MIEVIDPGLAVAVQDSGRFGLRRFGVPVAGALDRWLLGCANLLVGNDPEAAALELLVGGPSLSAEAGPVSLALSGEVTAKRVAADGTISPVLPWRAFILSPGEILRVSAPRRGVGYLAISGGTPTEELLGSRATYRRAGLGRFLAKGDRLGCSAPGPLRQGTPWSYEDGPIRLLAGPQDDHFKKESLEALESGSFTVGPASDRMGLRLSGPLLHHNRKGAEIPTDGVVPGALQVPGDGQPILLLADGQTTGGYAKIATAISADLPRLGHVRPGDSLRFKLIDRDEARKALIRRQADFARWSGTLTAAGGEIDQAALYRANLISGAVTGKDE